MSQAKFEVFIQAESGNCAGLFKAGRMRAHRCLWPCGGHLWSPAIERPQSDLYMKGHQKH